MPAHKRRKGYWKSYESARPNEMANMEKVILYLLGENPGPTPAKKSNRGRPPVHSKAKLDFACIMMLLCGYTYRDTEEYVRRAPHPWRDEPVPDHSWLTKHMQTVDIVWMNQLVAESALLCMGEIPEDTSSAAPDSTAVETDRYEDAQRPDKKKKGFVATRVKTYLKYHITVILGYQIVLAALITASNVTDTEMLKPMLDEIKRRGYDVAGRRFSADRGYDSDANCRAVFEMGMIPNLKQRDNAVSRGLPYRKKAARIYDPEEYKKRGMCEGVFGAEEARGHRLHCRFRLEENRARFGQGLALAWNIRALGRLKEANRLGLPLPPYGELAACA